MKIKEIDYLTPPSDLIDDCLDVFVSLDDDICMNEFCYFVEVDTPQFLSNSMKRSKSDFLEPGFPYIIVSKLTHEIIHAAIQSFIDTEPDSYWLKLYHITPTLSIEEINEILSRRKILYLKELKAFQLDSEMDAESDLND